MSPLRRVATRLLPRSAVNRLLEYRHFGLPMPFRAVRGHSMLSNLNLFFLEELARRVDEDRIPGDFVECGVYQGGSAAVLGYHALRSALPRKLWLYDAFAGMPSASAKDDAYSRSIAGQFVGSEAQTRWLMQRLGIPTDRYKIVVGWFDQTFPRFPSTPVALLHVDCDFYEPVLLTLRTFYPAVSLGGIVIFNDYGSFEGCRRAVDEFLLSEASPSPRLVQIDRDAYYLVKDV